MGLPHCHRPSYSSTQARPCSLIFAAWAGAHLASSILTLAPAEQQCRGDAIRGTQLQTFAIRGTQTRRAMYSIELLDGHARRDQSRVTGGRHTQPAFRGAEPVTDVAVVLPGWARAGPPAWPDLVRRGVASTSHVVQREDTRGGGGDNAFSCYG